MSFAQWCKAFFSSAGKFLVPFVASFFTAMGPILAQAAVGAVTAVAKTHGDKDGDAKRKAAFDMIEADLKAKAITVGVDVSAQMINRAIEAALAKTGV
ncbi:MAG: hypothetical protein FDZ69_07460 [Deltaproteobacteria bacterium]|nr:MAG: hypothetical protein FDZ69_07460 [Deltaproteobacteria bacterium]